MHNNIHRMDQISNISIKNKDNSKHYLKIINRNQQRNKEIGIKATINKISRNYNKIRGIY